MASDEAAMVCCPMPSNVPDLICQGDAETQWKRALVDVFHTERFTHALTLVWHRKASIERMRFDLKQLHRRIDKAIWGSRCERYPTEKRSRALFVAEDVSVHPHVHSLWRCPPGKLIEFNNLFPGTGGGLWNAVVASGGYKLDMINQGRIDEFAGYLLKKQHRASEADEIIWSDEFLPGR